MCDPSSNQASKTTKRDEKENIPPGNQPRQESRDILNPIINYEITRRSIEERSGNVRTRLNDWGERVTAEADYLVRAEQLLEGGELFTEWAALYEEMAIVLKERPVQDYGLYTAMSKLTDRQFVQFREFQASLNSKEGPKWYTQQGLRAKDPEDRRNSCYRGFASAPERSLGTKVIKGTSTSVPTHSAFNEHWPLESSTEVHKTNIETGYEIPSHQTAQVSEMVDKAPAKSLKRFWKRILKLRAMV